MKTIIITNDKQKADKMEYKAKSEFPWIDVILLVDSPIPKSTQLKSRLSIPHGEKVRIVFDPDTVKESEIATAYLAKGGNARTLEIKDAKRMGWL